MKERKHNDSYREVLQTEQYVGGSVPEGMLEPMSPGRLPYRELAGSPEGIVRQRVKQEGLHGGMGGSTGNSG